MYFLMNVWCHWPLAKEKESYCSWFCLTSFVLCSCFHCRVSGFSPVSYSQSPSQSCPASYSSSVFGVIIPPTTRIFPHDTAWMQLLFVRWWTVLTVFLKQCISVITATQQHVRWGVKIACFPKPLLPTVSFANLWG